MLFTNLFKSVLVNKIIYPPHRCGTSRCWLDRWVCWPCKNWDVFSFHELCTDPCNMRPCIIMLQHEGMVVDEGHNNGPQDLVQVSLCIQNTINIMHLCLLSITYEHADELPWDAFWQFVQKFFGYVNRLLQQLSGWLVSDDLGGEDAGCGCPGLVWLHVVCGCEDGWMYCQILWDAFGDGLWWWTFLQSACQLHAPVKTCDISGIVLW